MRENTKLRNKKRKILGEKTYLERNNENNNWRKIILRKTKDKYLEKKKYFGKKRETNKVLML
jgi:hypothetical protein